MLQRILVGSALSFVLVVACAPPEQAGFATSKDGTKGEESDVTDEECVEDEEAGSNTARSPLAGLDADAYDACECAAGGAARCIPNGTIPASYGQKLGTCDDGVCVPDSLIRSGGKAPKTCTSITGEGRCMSLCVPKVAEKADILDRGKGDVCEEDERCTPCLNPLEGNAPTGVCEIGKSGGGGTSTKATTKKKNCKKKKSAPAQSGDDDTGSADTGASCPYTGEPVDVSKFPACKEGGRCVPPSVVPPAQRSKLDACGDDGLCAPEKSVKAMGKFLPPTCVSVAGAEGRCLSKVIKDIAAKEGRIPQSTCDANELCAPCFDPTDGRETGACSSVACDSPKEPAKEFSQCCEGKGRCVPATSVDEKRAENLGSDGCQEGAELCAPAEDINRTTPRPTCNGTIKFLNKPYVGACVSRCTDLGIKGIILDQANCDSDHICAPCVHTLTGENTGACD